MRPWLALLVTLGGACAEPEPLGHDPSQSSSIVLSADEATVYLVVGPAGTPITAHQAVDALPPGFQRVVQRLYVAAQ